ncbi:MAG: hypothetical protein AAF938_19865 [Myxococcota bacterium]
MIRGDALIAFAFGDGLPNLQDADGRHLGEHTARAYADASAERRLTFHDPRDTSGFPANMAALRQVQAHWGFALALLGAPTRHATPAQQVLARTGRPRAAAIAAWLQNEAPSGEVAAAYKASLGFGQLIRFWLLDESLGDARTELPDERGLLALVDAEGWLVGQRHVCPGSRRAIAEGWRVLLGDDPQDYGASAEDVARAGAIAHASEGLARALSAVEGALVSLHVETRVRNVAAFRPRAETIALQYLRHVTPERAGAARLWAPPWEASALSDDDLLPAILQAMKEALAPHTSAPTLKAIHQL